MAATSWLGTTGYLLRSELASLMRCANVGRGIITTEMIDEVTTSLRGDEEQLGLAKWLRMVAVDSDRRPTRLSARYIVGLLLYLCNAPQHVSGLYRRYAIDGKLSLGGWLDFVRNEQMLSNQPVSEVVPSAMLSQPPSSGDTDELANAKQHFETTAANSRGNSDSGVSLSLLDFSVMLLSPQNNAVGCVQEDIRSNLTQAFGAYWTPATHK
eukprot:1477597-Prymnesium_polylepis.1